MPNTDFLGQKVSYNSNLKLSINGDTLNSMMNPSTENSPATPQHKPRPFIDLLISIVIPSFVLMKMSGENELGATGALILALSFPLLWGCFELVRYRKYNFIALLGLISVLLTGGIGLLQLDVQWLAIKEAAIPAVIGIAVLISTRTRYPLIRTLLFKLPVFDTQLIQQKLDEQGHRPAFESRLMKANYGLSGTFFFSALMNYVLAKWIVTSPSGSIAFNEELGRLTLLSYPIIAIPSTLMMMAILFYIWRTINGMTGLTLEQVMVDQQDKD